MTRVAKDEGETTNLAGEHPERAAAMLNRIKAWYAETQEMASPQPGGWLKAAAAKKKSKAKSLGPSTSGPR